ncbi:MAG: hypothetical protein ACLP7Q_23600 [Isosphaeraceae bacterium]
MMTPARILRLLGIAGLIGWLGMVGWVAKTSQAQRGNSDPVKPASEPVKPVDVANSRGLELPSALDAPPPVAPEAPLPSSTSTSTNSSSLSALPSDSPALERAETKPSDAGGLPGAVVPRLPATPAEPLGEPVAMKPERLPAEPMTTLPEDPEKSAQSFVEHNEKEIEDYLKKLTTEAAELRTRLTKLEVGITKWERLLTALRTVREQAGELEPIPPARAKPKQSAARPATASPEAVPTPVPAAAAPPRASSAPASPSVPASPSALASPYGPASPSTPASPYAPASPNVSSAVAPLPSARR